MSVLAGPDHYAALLLYPKLTTLCSTVRGRSSFNHNRGPYCRQRIWTCRGSNPTRRCEEKRVGVDDVTVPQGAVLQRGFFVQHFSVRTKTPNTYTCLVLERDMCPYSIKFYCKNIFSNWYCNVLSIYFLKRNKQTHIYSWHWPSIISMTCRKKIHRKPI